MIQLKYFIAIPILCLNSLTVSAQKKQFTIAEATNGLSTTLALENIKQPSWQPESNAFFQVVKNNGTSFWIRTIYPTNKTDTIERLQSLNKTLFGKDSLKGFPMMNWIDHDYAYFNWNNQLFLGTFTGNSFTWSSWVKIPADADHITVDASRQIAYTLKNNLFLVDGKNQNLTVTNESDENIVSGQAVHRNEFGIDKGIFFSPKGNLLAYYHMDQTMVKNYPVVDWSKMPATVNQVKYPMAGDVSHHVTLRIFNPNTKATTVIQTGEPKDQYLTAITWSPDEKSIFIGILNRDQNHLKLNEYDANSGKFIKTLFEEKDSKYVEPEHELTFLPNSNNEFIWWSERDGFDHLYLYDRSGKMLRQLTKGNFVVNEIVGFNEKNKEIIITAAKVSPLDKNCYAVNYTNGTMRAIDEEAGVHSISASSDGNYIYDLFTSGKTPRKCSIKSLKGNFNKVILESKNTLADYVRATVQNVTLKADDGTPLYGKLILPNNFDPQKKYPVIVYLYNGPHVQLIRNTFPESGNLWYEYMAQKGYIVFSMDGRGSSNRGKQFEQATFRQLGTVEMNDQLVGVQYLKSLPYVDANRMGVHGWSFGGFMTTSLMLRHPDVFKVGVAGGPVMDWNMYEIMYTERYMDSPNQNPEGYKQANLLDKVNNLKGKLLLIHGTDDATVVWQHSINFLKNAVSEGVQLDYFVYPGYEHNVRGKDRAHLMQKISDYFDTYLK